mmetsp:Transcript_47109/g.57882  ORF Transcript_47109/g.57882 Transcript_47109/m.57882 type:complete len:126 (+) Transcript_47109:25-402(+)
MSETLYVDGSYVFNKKYSDLNIYGKKIYKDKGKGYIIIKCKNLIMKHDSELNADVIDIECQENMEIYKSNLKGKTIHIKCKSLNVHSSRMHYKDLLCECSKEHAKFVDSFFSQENSPFVSNNPFF